MSSPPNKLNQLGKFDGATPNVKDINQIARRHAEFHLFAPLLIRNHVGCAILICMLSYTTNVYENSLSIERIVGHISSNYSKLEVIGAVLNFNRWRLFIYLVLY